MADRSLAGYDDDDNNNSSESSSSSSSAPRKKSARSIPYEQASKLTPSASLKDLTVKQLQDLLISLREGNNLDEIKRINDKCQLLRLITAFQNPSESLDGCFPVDGPVEVPMSDIECKFSREEEVGRGGFGVVYRGSVYHTPCAIKVVKNVAPHVMKQILPSLRKEIQIMRRNHHQNIVGLMCTSVNSSNSIHIVMPLMKGNLESYIKANAQNLSMLQRWDICHQILLGMNWLHSQNPPILHLDLKMENILYDEKGTMKITDFGLSAILDEDAGYLESRIRTPGNVGHMAPEVIQRRKFDEKADVYSLAVLLWEIMKGCEWESEVVEQLRQMRIQLVGSLRDIVKRAVCSRELRPSLLKVTWPESLKNLLRRMWALDPVERPSLSEVLATYFDEVKRDFKNLLLQEKINDQGGRSFWNINFGDNIEQTVEWNRFKSLFYKYLQLALPDNEKNTADPVVRHLLFLKLALNAHKTEEVKLERFGSVADAFGPILERGTEFLDKIQLTLSNRWFRSDLTQEDARTFLLGQEDGTFIVRFSSKVGVPFTLTRVKKGKVHQTRIYKFDNWFRVGEEQSKWKNVQYKSIIEIISDPEIQRAFDLRCYPQLQNVGLGEMLILTPLEDTNYINDGLDGSGLLEDILAQDGSSASFHNNLLN